MDIIAHTMEYEGPKVMESPIKLQRYMDGFYEEYKKIYEDCFHEMRTALQLKPVCCCDSREKLLQKQNSIFLFVKARHLVGSVAIYGNEIDDLFISKKHQRNGYGERLLLFAVHFMQERKEPHILLHVADWNQGALKMYLKNGFEITKTEAVK